MKQTVVAVFDSPLKANEALHVLEQARFVAERLPRLARVGKLPERSGVHRLLARLVDALRRFLAADLYLQPYARALAKGRFVVKVFVDDDVEADAARRIVELAGGRDIDCLADEWCEPSLPVQRGNRVRQRGR